MSLRKYNHWFDWLTMSLAACSVLSYMQYRLWFLNATFIEAINGLALAGASALCFVSVKGFISVRGLLLQKRSLEVLMARHQAE